MADDNTIQINVTATTDSLASGLASASKQVESFGNELNTLAARAQSVKPDAFKELAQALNEGKIDQDEFRDGLIGITTAQSAAANEAVNLAEKSTLTSGALRELTVVGRELATGNLTRLPGSLSILAQRLGGIPPQAILAAGAIAAVGYAIYAAIESSEKFEADLGRIQNAFTAVGAGNQFDRTQITQYIDDLRQIPGITEEMATSAVNSFSRVQNGTKLLGEATQDLRPLANLLGIDVPQAAKVLAEALNEPSKGLQDLKKYGVELSASQEEQIRQMMAVNNVADAQRVLLDGLSSAMAHVVDTSTPLERFYTDFKNSLFGVSEEALKTKERLEELAETATDPNLAEAARIWGSVEGIKARNIPSKTKGSGPGGTASIPDYDAVDQAEQTRKHNEQIEKTNQLYEHGNSLAAERETHLHNLSIIQQGIDAAEAQNNQEALKRANIDLETENKRYYGDAAPKVDHSQEKYALAEAKGDSEAAQARIKTEQDIVDEKLRLGQISTDDAVTQLRALAAEEHTINLTRIADMRAVYAGQGDRAGVAKSDSDAEVENQRYAQQDSKIDTQGEEATKKAQEAEIEGDRRVADAKAQTALQAMQAEVRLGKASEEQETELALATLNQKHAADEAYFNALAANYAQDSAAYKKTVADKEVADQKWQQQVTKLNTEAALRAQEDWSKALQPISRAFESSIDGMVRGTQTLQQTVARLGQNIESEFVNTATQGALQWVAAETRKTLATLAGNAARTASGASAAAEGMAIEGAANKESVIGNAWSAAAAVYNNVAQIPYVGWVLAPAAAAAAAGAVLAFGGSIPSAAGGMIVPNDTLAMVHENEMVLPARYTSGLTSMINQANAGQGAGPTNHFHVSVAANGRLNAGDLDGLHDAVVGSLKKAARNGQFGAMRSA